MEHRRRKRRAALRGHLAPWLRQIDIHRSCLRDDGRPADIFSWTRPWVPYGEDPFVWHDPAEDFPAARAPAPIAANDEAPEAKPRRRRARPAEDSPTEAAE